ncbi:murein tripeptide amidase MpaA [Fibrobacter sp. UWB11]|uniref:murein tripeptide amidase MpaA n=1 Tax=Fibrobacter sp. UWB11 TaxID=1896202 RepID=UPI000929B75C|nr:murein tripeptide amidase MpaA [Fibrobacter sp. UWB11]SIO15149.1 protein MpaA [Fibrobacter sp. UWB11]
MNFTLESRGIIRLKSSIYGRSVLGAPLLYFPCKRECKLLVIAGIHGEEPETTFLLSRVLRAFEDNFDSIAFILSANPDGMVLGTRGNVHGVDLNRNFKTQNFSTEMVASRSILEAPRDTLLSPGAVAGSEPETQALVELVEKLKPASVISMHAPMACVDAPQKTALVEGLMDTFNLPWLPDIGYKTPGSFGTWCGERGLECVTLELPRMSLEHLFDRYGRAFAEFLECQGTR